MNSHNLNRFGDTSFRLKKQTTFYLQILLYIHENKEVLLNKIYDYCKKMGIIRYSNDDKLNDSRSKLLIKQLKNFNLVEEKNNKVIISNFGKQIIEVISFCQDNKKPIEFVWYWLMLVAESNLSNIFQQFVNYLFQNKIEILDQNLIEAFITSKRDKFDSNSKYLYEEFLPHEVNKILKEGSIQSVKKSKKPIQGDTEFPYIINNLSNRQNIINLIENNSQIFKRLKEIYRHVTKRKSNVNEKKILEFIYSEREKLLSHAFNYPKYRTIHKDYWDINLRWLKEINLVYEEDKKQKINLSYKPITEKLLKISKDNLVEEFKIFFQLNNYKINSSDYPYDVEKVINMLSLASEERWSSLKDKYDLDNIANPTIYEYLVNISLSLLINNSIEEFRNSCNTILDYNNKPSSHAPGGKPDGILYMNKSCYSTIEATIISDLEQIINKERTSIHRHAVKLMNERARVIFVVNSNIEANLVYQFSQKETSRYIQNPSIIVEVILLSTDDLINILKKQKLVFFLKSIQNKFPIQESNDVQDIFRQYKKTINDLI